MLSFEGNLFTQQHEIWSQETTDSTLSYGENLESLSPGLGLVSGRDTRTGQTDRIMIASMRFAVACENYCCCYYNLYFGFL